MAENLLITGGAGFIGSHLVKRFLNHHSYRVINLDALTYAGNLQNLKEVEVHTNYVFVKGDIQDAELLDRVFQEYQIDHVIHLAAESHVDRSIDQPLDFVKTNVLGTVTLLNTAKKYLQKDHQRFHHVSTDEVFGSLGAEGFFTETTAYDPRSPYSASKASSDHFVMAYHHTYGLNVVLSNCSNNYGSYQFPEKLIPLMINNIKNEKSLPVYGKGINVRDWLWVEDHAEAIDLVFHKGRTGETYNIGGNEERTNIDMVHLLCDFTDQQLGRPQGTSRNLITFVKDRAGHDLRYAIDASKIKNELGWEPSITLEEGLRKTVSWYLENESWLEDMVSGAYQEYYTKHYKNR
ncbi:MAG: dTDP-glucose 4,6-dehydratase [Flavobacteriales bacterium]|nr:dTDP-glucose 4,6-dehydratase [Flavobacteriales bacterium]